MNHVLAGGAPSYCLNRSVLSPPLSPSQWATCFRYGYHEPTTTTANAGYNFGHYVLPVVIILAVLTFAAVFLRRRRAAAVRAK